MSQFLIGIINIILLIYFLKIEREKSDLSVQVITLSERLDEAEGGAESQVMNTLSFMTTKFHNDVQFYFSLKSIASAMLS